MTARTFASMVRVPGPDDYEIYEDDEDDEFVEDEPELGPDERDADLLDGSWEEAYYAGRVRRRDWNSIAAAIGILFLLGLLLPTLLVLLN